MGFERFTKIRSSYAPKVSIRTNAQLGFSQGMVKKYNMGEFKFCELYFNKDENKIGLKLTNDDDGKVANIFIKENNCFISAKTFMDYYEIPYKETRSYVAVKDDSSGLIIIDLNSPMQNKKRKEA